MAILSFLTYEGTTLIMNHTTNRFIKEQKSNINTYNDAAIFSAIISSRCSHLSEEILKMELPPEEEIDKKHKDKKEKKKKKEKIKE